VLSNRVWTFTQVVLLSITSTFTRVQIQSNLGTTAYCDDLKVMSSRAGKKNFLPARAQPGDKKFPVDQRSIFVLNLHVHKPE
jgi:hypothetical protein